jgi:hypothetical protein
MTTEPEASNGPVQLGLAQELPQILAVIEGTLTVSTDDDNVGITVLRGFRYLLACEFARQQPALSLLYELDLQVLDVRRGSREYDWKILVKLKKRVIAEVKKAGAIAVITAALGIPSAIVSGFELWEHLFPPVQIRLNSDMPQVPTTILVKGARQADSRDVPPATGNFDLV